MFTRGMLTGLFVLAVFLGGLALASAGEVRAMSGHTAHAVVAHAAGGAGAHATKDEGRKGGCFTRSMSGCCAMTCCIAIDSRAVPVLPHGCVVSVAPARAPGAPPNRDVKPPLKPPKSTA